MSATPRKLVRRQHHLTKVAPPKPEALKKLLAH
jgi:hypothetical protein